MSHTYKINQKRYNVDEFMWKIIGILDLIIILLLIWLAYELDPFAFI